WKAPKLVIVPPVTVKLPEPPMVDAASRMALPETLSVPPELAVKFPVPLVKVTAKMPESASTKPLLMSGTVSVLVREPSDLRSVPALAIRGLPLRKLKTLPSYKMSKVEPGALLQYAVEEKFTTPLLQVAGPALINAQPMRLLLDTLIFTPPFTWI